MRLIDADALNVAEEVGAVCEHMGLTEKSIFEAFVTGWLGGAINEAPTIDAVPVVRGEWIKVDQVYVKCSRCDKHYYNWAREYGYCPNCGADMRGSEVKE